MPYKAENWHTLTHEQNFLKRFFLDIRPCAFNLSCDFPLVLDLKADFQWHRNNNCIPKTKVSVLIMRRTFRIRKLLFFGMITGWHRLTDLGNFNLTQNESKMNSRHLVSVSTTSQKTL